MLSLSADAVHPTAEMNAERRLLHRSAEDVNRIVHGTPIGIPSTLGMEDRRASGRLDERKYGVSEADLSGTSPGSLYSWAQGPPVEPSAPLLPFLNYDMAKNFSAGIIGERPNGSINYLCSISDNFLATMPERRDFKSIWDTLSPLPPVADPSNSTPFQSPAKPHFSGSKSSSNCEV